MTSPWTLFVLTLILYLLNSLNCVLGHCVNIVLRQNRARLLSVLTNVSGIGRNIRCFRYLFEAVFLISSSQLSLPCFRNHLEILVFDDN